MHKIDRWFSANGEAFTRKPLVFSEIRPKSDEVKAKKRKTPDARMYACVRGLKSGASALLRKVLLIVAASLQMSDEPVFSISKFRVAVGCVVGDPMQPPRTKK